MRKWREREKIEREWGNGERGRNGERDLLPLHVFSFSPLHLHFLIFSPFSLIFPHFLSLRFLILSLSHLHFLILSPFSLSFSISKFVLHFLIKISNLALLMPNCLNKDVFSVLLFAGRLNLRHLSRASRKS